MNFDNDVYIEQISPGRQFNFQQAMELVLPFYSKRVKVSLDLSKENSNLFHPNE